MLRRGVTAVASSSMPPSSFRWVGISCELSKIRLSGFVASTALAGYAASGAPLLYFGTEPLHVASGAVLTSVGVLACSGAANALNQMIEKPRDAKMARTAKRPLPSGRCTRSEAGGFAAISAGIGTSALFLAGGPVPAALGLGNIAAYAGLYTYLKPRSELNTWVGAVVGAVPPLIGWAAAAETPLFCAPEPWLLALSIYLWQFPHFFALAWRHRIDYGRGGFAMIPCRDPTGERTSTLITRYSLYSLSVPILAVASGATSSMFALEAGALNALLFAAARRFERDRTTANGAHVFRVTLVYLPLLLLGFVVHSTRLASANDAQEEELVAKQTKKDAITLTDAVEPVREIGRAACIHEQLIASHKTNKQLCPLSSSSSPSSPAPNSADNDTV